MSLGVTIKKVLNWSTNTTALVKKAQQRLIRKQQLFEKLRRELPDARRLSLVRRSRGKSSGASSEDHLSPHWTHLISSRLKTRKSGIAAGRMSVCVHMRKCEVYFRCLAQYLFIFIIYFLFVLFIYAPRIAFSFVVLVQCQ